MIDVLKQGAEKFYMAGKLVEKDRKVLDKVLTLSPALVSDVLRKTSNLDLTTYLMYIYQRFGRTVFNHVLQDVGSDIKIQKTLTLDDLHIYGSSRYGINKPKKMVTRKSYILEEIESDGEFAYSAGRDSTFAKTSKTNFKRTLTYKQYELTNHLGNVLATVLDRKTLVTNSGDTFYSADVSTAGMYYAFGSSITDLAYTHDTGKYRYGFNGEEKEADISGEGMVYDLGARFYDGRLGRMFSVDPLEAKYPFWSPYAYCGNSPISLVDIDGMGPGDGTKTEKVGSGNGPSQVAERQKNGTTMNDIALLNPNYFPGYYSGKDSNGKTYWQQKDGNGAPLWHWSATDDVIVPVKKSNEFCGPIKPTSQKDEATILQERMNEIYRQADRMGCPNSGNPACSTYYEQISVLAEQHQWASLDHSNGQVLLPLKGYWNGLYNSKRIINEKLYNQSGEFLGVKNTDYIINSDGYIINKIPHMDMKMGIPPIFTVASVNVINFQSLHVAKHLMKLGISQAAMETAIMSELQIQLSGASLVGGFWGRVVINGQTVIYRAYVTEKGVLNIGTYFTPR